MSHNGSRYGFLQRASYDGALCTIRHCFKDGEISGTKGEWYGIEWDDPNRGKHNGTHNGQNYFECKSSSSKCASFIRPSRNFDREVTLLEAIQRKYSSGPEPSTANEIVIISGKVAEEIGFDKIAKEQSILDSLKVVIVDRAIVHGLAARGATREQVELAQAELAKTCPNITELDVSYNPIERWDDIYDICVALPKLKTLRLNGLRLELSNHHVSAVAEKTFASIQELHLNECLLRPFEIFEVLGLTSQRRFPSLRSVWLSQNELDSFENQNLPNLQCCETVQELILENNLFRNLDSIEIILKLFPMLSHLSLQGNLIDKVGEKTSAVSKTIPLSFDTLQSINLSQNKIQSFGFVDTLTILLPRLTALVISRNPLYDNAESPAGAVMPTEVNYYLTLARIPSLAILNYTNITSRDREEGEIYYLSIAEQDINSMLSQVKVHEPHTNEQTLQLITTKYSKYQTLCEKHDRESILTSLLSPSSNLESVQKLLQQSSRPAYPTGSIAARLVNVTFYIPATRNVPELHHNLFNRTNSDENQPQKQQKQHSKSKFTRPLPTSLPTTQIFSLVTRELALLPLQFKLIYESPELDPVQDDISTRSQIYQKPATAPPPPSSLSTATATKQKGRWDDWGDWDFDHLTDPNNTTATTTTSPTLASSNQKPAKEEQEKFTEEGYLVRNGKKWKKREIEILMGVRAWGDWLDRESDGSSDILDGPNKMQIQNGNSNGMREVRIRVEPFERIRDGF